MEADVLEILLSRTSWIASTSAEFTEQIGWVIYGFNFDDLPQKCLVQAPIHADDLSRCFAELIAAEKISNFRLVR